MLICFDHDDHHDDSEGTYREHDEYERMPHLRNASPPQRLAIAATAMAHINGPWFFHGSGLR